MKHITVGQATREEHETVIRALYGSVEKMLAHPNYTGLNKRMEYLEALKVNIKLAIAEIKKEISWWDVVNQLAYLGAKVLIPVIDKEIDGLLNRIKAQMALPVGFVVGEIESDFDTFIADKYKVIERVNKTLGITDDPFINPSIS